MRYELDGIEFVDARLYALWRDGREVMLNRQQYRAHMFSALGYHLNHQYIPGNGIGITTLVRIKI